MFCCLFSLVSQFASFVILLALSCKIAKCVKRHFMNQEPISSVGKAVLITGCDTGFGNRLALRLNELGFTVFATVLDVSSDGAKQLSEKALIPAKMRVIKMNVTSDVEVANAYQEVCEQLKPCGIQLWAVVNNAGIALYGSIEWGSMESFKKVIDVNTFGLVRVTRTFLPLIRQSKGRIVNMSSIGARIASRVLTAYCMSKLAANSFSDALRREMRKWGVNVSVIEPGAFNTQMISVENMHKSVEKEWNVTPEKVREDYGPQYLDTVKQKCVAWQQSGANDNIDIVVDCIIDALRSREPLVKYAPIGDWKTRFVSLFVEYLPMEVIDRLVEF